MIPGDTGTSRSPTAATGHVPINTLISLRCFAPEHRQFVQINDSVEIPSQVTSRAGKFRGQDLKKGPLLVSGFLHYFHVWKNQENITVWFQVMLCSAAFWSTCIRKKTGWRKLTARQLISTNYLHWQGEELILLPEENDNSYPFLTNTITLTIIGCDVCWLDLHILNVSIVSTPRRIPPQKSNETAQPNVSLSQRP